MEKMSDQRLEELFQHFLIDNQDIPCSEQTESFHCDEADVDLLSRAINHSEPSIRAKAYRCLQHISSECPDTQKAIVERLTEGIPLRPGDRIYSVYKAAVSFDDEFYHLENTLMDNLETHLEDNWEAEGFESKEHYLENLMEERDEYIPKRISRHVFRTEAAAVAIALHRQCALARDHILEFELNQDFDFLAWCRENNLITPNFSRASLASKGFDEWEFMAQLLQKLKADNQLEMLGDLVLELIGSFTFVREETIKEHTYLKQAELSC